MQLLESHTVTLGAVEYTSHPRRGVQVSIGYTRSGWSRMRPFGFDNLTALQATSIGMIARVDRTNDTLTSLQKSIISSCIEELDLISSLPSPKLKEAI